MRLSVMLAAALLLSACDDDAPNEPQPNASSRTIPTLGTGAVAERYTAEVTARGNYAYTSSWGQRNGIAGNAVYVWNVSAATPQLVRTVTVPSVTGTSVTTTGDVQVSDDGSLLGVATERVGGSFVLYSLADPSNPTFVSQFHSADTDAGVHTAEIARVGGKLYAFLSVDPLGGTTPARLVVLDIGDPAAPTQVLARPMGTPYVHDVFARDSLLFTALWNGGMTIWDIGGSRGGTAANPIQISNMQTVGGKVHNMWWYHDPTAGKRYVFVGEEGPTQLFSSTSGDIHVVDISSITAPVEVAYYTLAGAGTHNFWVDEPSGVLYAAYYNGGVRAIDVRGDLSQCAAAAREGTRCNLAKAGRELGNALNGGFVWGVHGVGTRLYASDMLSGLKILDISTFKR